MCNLGFSKIVVQHSFVFSTAVNMFSSLCSLKHIAIAALFSLFTSYFDDSMIHPDFGSLDEWFYRTVPSFSYSAHFALSKSLAGHCPFEDRKKVKFPDWLLCLILSRQWELYNQYSFLLISAEMKFKTDLCSINPA